MKSKTKKSILLLIGLMGLGVLIMIITSPFGHQNGFKYKLILHSTEINAPVDSVYNFLGRSSNAAKWSVFVNHISTLNEDKVADGGVGCQRRCFKNEDEKGLQWDEEITIAEANKRRQLTIFNMRGFDMQADGLVTEQIYEPLTSTKTKLSFTLFYLNNNPSIIDLFKTYFSAFEVKNIYERNMLNIKNIIETGHK